MAIKKCRFCGRVMYRVIMPMEDEPEILCKAGELGVLKKDVLPGSYKTWWECSQGHKTTTMFEWDLGPYEVVAPAPQTGGGDGKH